MTLIWYLSYSLAYYLQSAAKPFQPPPLHRHASRLGDILAARAASQFEARHNGAVPFGGRRMRRDAHPTFDSALRKEVSADSKRKHCLVASVYINVACQRRVAKGAMHVQPGGLVTWAHSSPVEGMLVLFPKNIEGQAWYTYSQHGIMKLPDQRKGNSCLSHFHSIRHDVDILIKSNSQAF